MSLLERESIVNRREARLAVIQKIDTPMVIDLTDDNFLTNAERRNGRVQELCAQFDQVFTNLAAQLNPGIANIARQLLLRYQAYGAIRHCYDRLCDDCKDRADKYLDARYDHALTLFRTINVICGEPRRQTTILILNHFWADSNADDWNYILLQNCTTGNGVCLLATPGVAGPVWDRMFAACQHASQMERGMEALGIRDASLEAGPWYGYTPAWPIAFLIDWEEFLANQPNR